jgi:riboflavin kinase/FMN adenylyltransferase
MGHQAILQTVVRKAREMSLPAVAMTFEPHPIQVLYPEKAPKRISTPKRKIEQIEKCGIDVLYMIHFDREFAKITADKFIRQYLVEGLGVRAICVGSNFNFGHRQEGSINTLRQWAREFELVEVPPVTFRALSASSTQVRKYVINGEVSQAARLLGRWYEIEGRIVSGVGRGRKVTVPTLNLDPSNELLPAFGVYVTRISLDGGSFLDAVSNIGVRPTFGENAPTIETFVLRDAVPPARTACLQFLHRIREEKRFDSSDLLARQIGLDVQAALKFFRRLTHVDEHARTHSH